MKNVLILCTGNSCRSIMAEAILNEDLAECVKAYSAGVEAKGAVNPNALQVMKNRELSQKEFSSINIDQLPKDVSFDLVVTVCDHAKETCPMFPGKAKTIHVGFEDPDGAGLEEFEKTFDLIREELVPVVREHLC